MRVVLVHQGDVVVDILLLFHHPAHAVADDHDHLVRECRIVGDAVRNRRRQHMAVAVFVLQPFAVQGRASRRAAEQEAARAHVAGKPCKIADPLQTEHRVVDIERDHRHVVGAVRRRRGDPRAHRTGFVDAFLQHLARFVFAVVHQLVGVLRLVQLADC